MPKQYIELNSINHTKIGTNTYQFELSSPIQIHGNDGVYLVSESMEKTEGVSLLEYTVNSYFRINVYQGGTTYNVDMYPQGQFKSGTELATYLTNLIRDAMASNTAIDAGHQNDEVTFDTATNLFTFTLYTTGNTASTDQTVINFRLNTDPFTYRVYGFNPNTRIAFNSATAGLVSISAPNPTYIGPQYELISYYITLGTRPIDSFNGQSKSTFQMDQIANNNIWIKNKYDRNILLGSLKAGDDVDILTIRFDAQPFDFDNIGYRFVLAIRGDEKGK